MNKAIEDVIAERTRQVRAEGWTASHDDEHDPGELAAAGSAYALNAADQLHPQSQGDGSNTRPIMWPWDLCDGSGSMAIKDLIYDVRPLKDAIAEFDRTAAARQLLWNSVSSNEEVGAAESADKAALRRVQDAFYDVTRDRNSHEHCLRVELEFMRRIANLGAP